MQDTRILRRTVAAAIVAVSYCAAPGLGADTDVEMPVVSDALRTRGQEIYAQSCVDCHGEQGEGVEGVYEQPLIGDSSIGELTRVIQDTMPDGEPEACVGEEAAAVAAYIHHAFYSEAARIRNRPPRIALSRLTGNQLRQSLADLYQRFTGHADLIEDRGLEGDYFDGARYRRENRKIERVDRTIDFDFQHDGPGEGITPEDFFIRWRGGLKIDETGEYEIVVRSTCAFLMYLGDYDREFINNRVQSGDKTEFRKSIVLTAGRVYPIQIDMYQRKRKTEQPPARMSLSWIAPEGTERIVPARHLVPASVPATFSLQTKLPPDDRSYGYERGISVNREWDESTTSTALEFAGVAIEELWPRYRRAHRDASDENRERLKNFLAEVVETAFRGPLDEETRRLYVDAQVAQTEDDAEAIRRSLLAALKSPRFLYPGLDMQHSPSQRAANRLALALYDSLPSDEWLVQMARNGQLDSEQAVRDAARRMIDDDRARAKARGMIYEWLNLTHIGEITKNSEQFPEFDPELVADLKVSLDAFIDEILWSEGSDYRQLLQADWAYTTPRLAEYYGEVWQPRDSSTGGLTRSVSDSQHRIGLLSHPYLMSGLAYQDATSPIHRGVFLIRYVLGRTLRPPEAAIVPLSPDLHPDMTTRERVALQTSPENCQVCHSKINALGFTLENFAADGRFRVKERGKDVDTSGQYTTREGRQVDFAGPRDLAEFLVSSDDAHRAFVNRAFQHFVKQPIAAYGADRLNELTQAFRESGFRIRNLLVEVAVIAATRPLETAKADQHAAVNNRQEP